MGRESSCEPLLQSLQGYLKSPELSDAIIRCEDREFKIHRLVVCAQSKYFSKALGGNWVESSDRCIHLKEDDISAVEAMLHFMYTFDFDAGIEKNSSPMIFNVKVYNIADKYDIPALMSLAKEKFETTVKTCWDMDDFPNAIALVYNSTPALAGGLRPIVVDAFCKHIDRLSPKSVFCDVLEETVCFASDVAQQLAKNLLESQGQKQDNYKCPSCNNQWKASLPSRNASYYCMHCGNRYSNWGSYVV